MAVIAEGRKAPDFTLEDGTGERVLLSDLRFHRSAWPHAVRELTRVEIRLEPAA